VISSIQGSQINQNNFESLLHWNISGNKQQEVENNHLEIDNKEKLIIEEPGILTSN